MMRLHPMRMIDDRANQAAMFRQVRCAGLSMVATAWMPWFPSSGSDGHPARAYETMPDAFQLWRVRRP